MLALMIEWLQPPLKNESKNEKPQVSLGWGFNLLFLGNTNISSDGRDHDRDGRDRDRGGRVSSSSIPSGAPASGL